MPLDNKLRCALVYRMPRGKASSVVLLAKFDHASVHEVHKSSVDSGTLYGGRDKNYSAVAMVIANDPPSRVKENNKIGGFKVMKSEMHQVIYGADNEGICLAVITGLKYPPRIAITMLTELYGQFSDKFGLQAAAATTNSLSRKAKSLLESICRKYDDPENTDHAAKALGKVDAIKGTMASNISSMLENTEKAEDIAEKSELMKEQATVFKKKSNTLKKKMWWKDMKTTIMLVALITTVVLIIVIPWILKVKRAVS